MAGDTAEQPLSGQIALVTGASRGIGAAIAKSLAGAGAHVILTARDTRALESVEEQIHAAGGTATLAPLDLAEPDAIARLAVAVAERWKRLDILIVNGAVFPALSAVHQIDQKGFGQALTVNVLATQALLAQFTPLMKRSERPRVIGMTSSVGATPRAYWGAYGATKAAFDVLLECHGQEMENISGTRVAIIDPGATRTAMRARAFPGEDPETVKLPEVVGGRIVALLRDDFPNLHRERIEKGS
ncbi:MAG: SDR family NAD(P)-dependent oxidoreductase [Novosphingobium sp.]|nr:SDR family NAD(P)-dependent oxidoreductase [Novosphingobium sp.]